MKKMMVLLLVTVYVIAIVGCTSEDQQPESLAGYMVIEGDTLYLDQVEIVRNEDVERIEELGLNSESPTGYHIYNPDTEKNAYELTDETIYNFVDAHVLFVEEDGDRDYTTTNKEEFLQHLDTSYYDLPPAQTVPFFIEVQDGKVISATEKIEFTI